MSHRKSYRIAVFGGTFDPLHNAHLHMAEKVIERNCADEILFVPAMQPPHKPASGYSGFTERLQMCETAAALMNNNKDIAGKYSVSDIEGEIKNSPSYTFDTMRLLADIYPDAILILLIGGDSLLNLHTWHKADKLVNSWNILTYPRDGISYGDMNILEYLKKKWDERIAYSLFQSILNIEICDISSTEIRNSISKGEDVSPLISPEVYKLIKEKGLYKRD